MTHKKFTDEKMQRIITAANECLNLDKSIEELEEARLNFETVCVEEGF